MKKNVFLFALAAALMMTSCAGKKELLNCQTENKSLTEKLQDAREDLAAKNARIASLEEQQKGMQQMLKAAEDKYAKLQESLDKSLTNASQNNVSIEKLVDQINESNQYIRHLVEVKSKSDSLNMVLTNNLTRSLSKEELKEVDVQVLKGVVYISLADNMLYKSGSYEINARAAETLSKIAKIIKDYKDYDVLIEGNTDNVPIKKQNIRNNWDLSTLRASRVVVSIILSPATTQRQASSVTVVLRSSSLQSSMSLWTSSVRLLTAKINLLNGRTRQQPKEKPQATACG